MAAGPDIWGPHGWKFLHFVTLGYPPNPTEQDKETYRQFFLLFAQVIPCGICANHFKENLKKHPLNDEVMSNKNNLIHWGIKMHNEVNRVNGKEEYSFDQGVQMILDGSMPYNCSKKSSFETFSNTVNYEWIIIIILIGIIILLVANPTLLA